MGGFHTGITGEFELLTDEFSMSDRTLVLKLAGGDQRALAALFRRFGRVVRGFLARMQGTRDADLDDLMQTTFVELASAADGFEGRSEVRTWLCGIAANVVRHHIRRERRRRDCISQLGRLPTRPPPLPDDVAEQRRYLRKLGSAMDQLSVELRDAYWLCVVHQVSSKDAAAELGVPIGTLTRRVCEARKRLSAAIGRGRDVDDIARSLRSRSFV